MSYASPPPLSQTYDRLSGRTVLVTGASSGIGAAAARLFAAEGAQVVLAARRCDLIKALAQELTEAGRQAAAVACDVRDEASIKDAVSFALDRYGKLDGAFNNAGVGGAHGPVHELDASAFDRVIAVNLRGVMLCLKHEAAAMLTGQGGAIVNTSSIGGLVGAAGNAAYAASKWGLAGLTKCAALDYARHNIRVNAVAPGPTRSEMFDRWMPDEASRAKMAEHFPMNYIAAPEDVSRVVLFLLSDEARWMTGSIIPCEGGAASD